MTEPNVTPESYPNDDTDQDDGTDPTPDVDETTDAPDADERVSDGSPERGAGRSER